MARYTDSSLIAVCKSAPEIQHLVPSPGDLELCYDCCCGCGGDTSRRFTSGDDSAFYQRLRVESARGDAFAALLYSFMHKNNEPSTYARQHYWARAWRECTAAESAIFRRAVNARLAAGIDHELPALIYAGYPAMIAIALPRHEVQQQARPSRILRSWAVTHRSRRVHRRGRQRRR